MVFNERKANVYSRPRFKLPIIKHNKNNIKSTQPSSKTQNKRRNNKKFRNSKYYTIVLIVVTMLTTIFIVNHINPIVDEIAINELTNKLTEITNKEAEKIMKNYQYEDLVTVIFDKDNNISMIQAKTNNINNISHIISINVLEELKKNNNNDITIYMGNLLGVTLLSGTGPKIVAKISSTGNIATNLKSEFSSTGINQTLHRIYLEIAMNVSILTPYHAINSNAKSQVLLSESIIVGNVPDTYYYLNNKDSVEAKDFIE